jgi:hypothetical protein
MNSWKQTRLKNAIGGEKRFLQAIINSGRVALRSFATLLASEAEKECVP